MLASDRDPKPRRRRPRPCPFCDASAAGCDSLRWLRSQPCCQKCGDGNHDRDDGGTTPDAAA